MSVGVFPQPKFNKNYIPSYKVSLADYFDTFQSEMPIQMHFKNNTDSHPGIILGLNSANFLKQVSISSSYNCVLVTIVGH